MKKLNIFPSYKNRSERNQFIVNLILNNKYDKKNKILNISGGGKLELKNFLIEKNYTNIIETDIIGKSDKYLDLEKDKFPFNKNSFDIVITTDVLEHLDNFHDTLDNLVKTTKHTLIISLPNSFSSILNILKNKKNLNSSYGLHTKYYGLPIKKPNDRHKWWFINEDVINYFLNYEKNNQVNIKYFFHQINKTSLKYFLKKILFGNRICNLLYQISIWLIIEK